MSDKQASIARAFAIQKDAAEVGFDWPCAKDVVGKLDEELLELKTALQNQDQDNLEEEIGDMFYTLINFCRHVDIDAEKALNRASDKFKYRFARLQKIAQEEQFDIKVLSLAHLEEIWQKAKGQVS